MDPNLTSEQVYKIFSESDLPDEFKSIICNRFNGMCQAMYNSVYALEKSMKVTDPHGDHWVEEYNRFVTEYQKIVST